MHQLQSKSEHLRCLSLIWASQPTLYTTLLLYRGRGKVNTALDKQATPITTLDYHHVTVYQPIRAQQDIKLLVSTCHVTFPLVSPFCEMIHGCHNNMTAVCYTL